MAESVNVITAGPSSGKSSTLREISSRGYNTMPEAASRFIHQKISEGYDAENIRDEFDFQKELIRLNREIESNINGEIVFLDRSLADNIAYMRHQNMGVPENLIEECEDKYDNIFLLERIEFTDDETRNEDEEEAAEIHKQIRKAYRDLGYAVIDVPVVPIDERADIILDKI